MHHSVSLLADIFYISVSCVLLFAGHANRAACMDCDAAGSTFAHVYPCF